ncbi:hypothetical protein TEHN7118_1129 [Tetragenococcus halophilus subsp. halophilus]|uniref:Uncharacterized protein n=1 Tax=Tetragenococcus halophilus subsp. halophilus TaxID=1513897 RepID=A0A2H6CTK0_TETHA|nr:hypothetical protein TEHN7118_1129 [Tetragenococcus halophilus subsp. halophilus]
MLVVYPNLKQKAMKESVIKTNKIEKSSLINFFNKGTFINFNKWNKQFNIFIYLIPNAIRA